MNFYDMNKMLTTLILYFVWWSIGQAENCQKYDRPRFESEWCAIYDISYTSSNGLYCRDSFLQAPLVLTIRKDQNPSVFYKFCWFVFSSSLTHTVAVRCEMLYIESMGECMIARDIEFMWRINALVCYFWPPSCSCPYKMLIQQNIDTLHKLFTAETKREKNLFASILKKQGSEIRFFVFCSLETYITICKRK